MGKAPKHKLTDADRRRGGKSLAAKLTPEQRSASARHAANARHAKARAVKRVGSALRKAAAQQ